MLLIETESAKRRRRNVNPQSVLQKSAERLLILIERRSSGKPATEAGIFDPGTGLTEAGYRLVFALRIELQRRRIDAVALAGRLRAVGENVPQVGATFRADDFVAHHAMARIQRGPHAFFVCGIKEAWPAAAGVKLCLRGKQFRPAANAAVHPVRLVIPVLAAERHFGAFLARDAKLLGRKLLAPLVVGFMDIVRHGYQLI